MIVVGIDVGLQVTGYVVCSLNGTNIQCLKEDQVKTVASESLAKRIACIYQALSCVFDRYKPEAVVLEKLYSHYRHPTTVSSLAQVRGALLLLIEKNGLPYYEYSPTKARKAFMGRGSADSARVKKMAENILGRTLVSAHTADAFSLVVALTHELRVKRMHNDRKN